MTNETFKKAIETLIKAFQKEFGYLIRGKQNCKRNQKPH